MIWHKTKFRNVAHVVYGKGLPERARKSKGEIPVFGSGGIVGNHTQCLVDFPTIVLARKGSIGNVFKTKKSSWPIDTVYYLKNIKLNIDYLYYYLMSQKFKDTSTAVPSLRREDLEDIDITYPENENIQINIVEAIDTQFTRLDATVKALNKIKKKLEVYRESILNSAFKGKMILFDYKLVLKKVTDGAKVNEYAPTNILDNSKDVSFVPMADVEEKTGKINLKQTRKFGEVKNGYTRFKEGDIIFAKITPCMENGKIALAENLKNGVGCGSTEFHVFTPLNNINKHFLLFYLLQKKIREIGKQFMKGTSGHMRLREDYLKKLDIAIPSLTTQEQVVKEIESRFSVIDKIEQTVNASLKKAEQLRKSILKSAFEGKLVKYEGDNND